MSKIAGEKMKKVNILALGNSFSQDCMSHVYGILKSLGVEDIQLGNLVIGGCSLETHCNNLRGDLPAYDYESNDKGVWEYAKDYKVSDALALKKWDFIFTQQYSGHSGMAETYAPLDEVLAYFKNNAKGNPKYGWQMTWAYAQDSQHPAFVDYGNSQQQMYESIVNAVQKVILPKGLTVIPSGTAVENGRVAFGESLTRDTFHLSLDLGRYIAGLCVVKALVGLDIDNVTFAPESVTDEQRKMAIAVANAACEKPFERTDINNK